MVEHLRVDRQGEVAVVRIDRPPANALDPELLDEACRSVAGLAADPPGAVVVTGRDGFFSAGLDLKVVPSLEDDERREMVAAVNTMFAGWYGFPGPVVCAVNGHAVAGGLILALCGDYRVGTAGDARLGLTEVKVGVPYPAVAMAVVRAELSAAAARVLTLKADLVGPDDALRLGLLDELVEGDPLPRALDVARELAALPARVYAETKQQLRGEALAAAREADPLR